MARLIALLLDAVAVLLPAEGAFPAPGDELWVSRDARDGQANDLAVSAEGSKVFVTGQRGGLAADYVTIAYDAASGRNSGVVATTAR